MSVLRKRLATTIIPGSPGVRATPGAPWKPPYCVTYTVLTLTYTDEFGRVVARFTGEELNWGWWGGAPAPEARATVTERRVTDCYPATPAVNGLTGYPPTPAQIITSLNSGWNSWARSINPIPAGKFIQVSVGAGVHAAFLSLGEKSLGGHGIHVFVHALLVDLSGVWVYESGVKVKRLRVGHQSGSLLRIVRGADNSVAYLIITGKETVAHTSTVKASAFPLYGFGYLYSAGDTINNPGITTGAIQYGRA